MLLYLSILDFLSGQLDHSADFGGNTEVFKESLMSRPELTPHRLFHALLCINQVCSLLKLLTCTHPLKGTKEDNNSLTVRKVKINIVAILNSSKDMMMHTSFTDLLYMLIYFWLRGTSSILNVTPVKLSCRAMYIPLSFMSIATISMAPTPLI